MLPSMKTAFTLLCLLQLISSRAMTPSPQQILKEVILLIQQLNSGVQVPCNDTRVAQVTFTDRKLPDQELLCQADMALTKVTRCKEVYEPLITNLKRLHGKKNCFLKDENEIYLRHFLPVLGNFTQGMYRRRGSSATHLVAHPAGKKQPPPTSLGGGMLEDLPSQEEQSILESILDQLLRNLSS